MEIRGESWLFWRESVWLPPNMTWADVAPVEGVARYTRFTDLFYPVPAALLVVLVRRIAERFCFLPLGKSLGLRATSNLPPPHNPTLELRFQEMQTRSAASLNRCRGSRDGEGGLTARQVHNWMKKRRLQGKPTVMDKFCETGWRLFYYSAAFLFGLVCLWPQPWLWNIRLCW